MSKRTKSSRSKHVSQLHRSLPTAVPGATTMAAVSTSDEESGIAMSPKRSVRKESEQKRRVMMNQYYDELVMLLSIITDRVAARKMDKTSILNEAVRTIKLYSDLDCSSSQVAHAITEYRPRYMDLGTTIQHLLDAMNAVLMVVSDNGRILYITEMITSLTGHMPTRLIGQSIFDCIGEEDKLTMSTMFELPLNLGTKLIRGPLVTYPARQFECQFKISGNESTQVPSRNFSCTSFLRKWESTPDEEQEDPPSPGDVAIFGMEEPMKTQGCALVVAKTKSSLSPVDLPITTNDTNFQFDMKISKEGKILDVDHQATMVLGYTTAELIGSSFFECVDPYHIQKIAEAITTYLSKGLGVSQPYRISSKSGRYVWVVSKGFLSYSPWNHKLDHVLLQNKVLGCDEILSEFRFTVDNKLLPNLTEDEYVVSSTMTGWSTSSNQRTDVQQPYQSVGFAQQLSNPTDYRMPMSVLNDPLNDEKMRRELERKNQELFALQQKILQQRQLFQQERSQFYQVTNQMMSYIGNQPNMPNPSSILQPNMAVAMSAAVSQLPESQPTQTALPNFDTATSQVSMLHTQQPPLPHLSQGPKSHGKLFMDEGLNKSQPAYQQFQQHDQLTYSYD